MGTRSWEGEDMESRGETVFCTETGWLLDLRSRKGGGGWLRFCCVTPGEEALDGEAVARVRGS